MAANVYAPNSRVYLGNSMSFVGAISADRVYFNNSVKFRFPPGMDSGLTMSSGVFRQTDWTEGRVQPPTPADPESGCVQPARAPVRAAAEPVPPRRPSRG